MDAAVIRFSTAFFDVTKERPNPINPIAGESLLLWLAEQLRDRAPLSSPDAEDWGWYSTVECEGRRYMLGTSASEEEVHGMREWVLQVVKHRSLKERLMGQEPMTPEDPCVRLVLDVLRNEPAFIGTAVD